VSEPAPTAPTARAESADRSQREDQPLQFSDRRAAIGIVAGMVALGLVGIAGGALFRDACDELFTVGERRTFVQGDPAEVVSGDPVAAQELLAYGQGAGLGDWRGSVVLDPGTEVVAAPDGFLVFTAGGIDALEPGLMAVNASRGTAGGRALPAFRGAAVAAAGDAPYEVAVLDEDLALIGCGEVVRDAPILAIDRVRTLHDGGATLSAVGLDGQAAWSRGFDHEVVRADLLLGAVLVTTAGDLHLLDLAEGATIRSWPLEGAELLALDARRAVVRTSPRTVVLDLVDGSTTDLDADATLGVVLVRDVVVAAADLPPLPGALELIRLHATQGGYLGVEVDAGTDRRLLLYGPTAPPRR